MLQRHANNDGVAVGLIDKPEAAGKPPQHPLPSPRIGVEANVACGSVPHPCVGVVDAVVPLQLETIAGGIAAEKAAPALHGLVVVETSRPGFGLRMHWRGLGANTAWKGQIGKDSEYLDGHQEDYVTYNNWDITKNCIKRVHATPEKFEFLDLDSDWGQYDMIMSTWSYGFHYPLDTYWDKVMSSLKPGGKLLLDLYNSEDSDRVSSALGCEPKIGEHQTMKRYLWKTDQVNYG